MLECNAMLVYCIVLYCIQRPRRGRGRGAKTPFSPPFVENIINLVKCISKNEYYFHGIIVINIQRIKIQAWRNKPYELS